MWDSQEGWFDDRPCSFQVYTPARTVVVYSLNKDEEEPIKFIDVRNVDDELVVEVKPGVVESWNHFCRRIVSSLDRI